MDIQNLSWDLFSKTGSVDAYLEYKAIAGLKKKKETEDGKCQCQRNSSETE